MSSYNIHTDCSVFNRDAFNLVAFSLLATVLRFLCKPLLNPKDYRVVLNT